MESSHVTRPSNDFHICWVCLDEDPNGMISPCNCKGSMGHVHEACLIEWIRRKASENRLNRPSCPHCCASYKIQDVACDSDCASVLEVVHPCAKAHELYKLAKRVADDEDRAAMIAGYAQRFLVLLSLASTAFLGIGLLLRFGLNPSQADSSSFLTRDAAITQWSEANPVSVLGTLLSERLHWSEKVPEASSEQISSSDDGVVLISVAWSFVFLALQRAAEVRIFFNFIMALVIGELVPVRSRTQNTHLIPLVFQLVRGLLIRSVYWGGLATVSPVFHSVLEFFVWRILASYVMVAFDLISVLASFRRLVADLMNTVDEDLVTLQSALHLQEGRLSVADKLCDTEQEED